MSGSGTNKGKKQSSGPIREKTNKEKKHIYIYI